MGLIITAHIKIMRQYRPYFKSLYPNRKNFAFLAALLIQLFLNPHYSEGQEPIIKFIAVGDIMMGRNIDKVMKKRGDIYPFMNFITPFKKGDIIFGNLESILGDEKDELYFPKKKYTFMAPLSRTAILDKLGFNVLSMANNHVLDYGPGAINKTRRAMKRADIHIFGAGRNLVEARQAAIILKKGVIFGFLGYSIGHSHKMNATAKKAGVSPGVRKNILEDIAKLRPNVDVMVVSMHWGFEYEQYPTEEQRKLAYELVDSGADMILGHHPHVMQGIEVYKDKPIIYSLGNFIFDQKHDDTSRSFMIDFSFKGKNISKTRIIPLSRYSSFFPIPAGEEKRLEILNHIREISLPLNEDVSQLKKIGL